MIGRMRCPESLITEGMEEAGMKVKVLQIQMHESP